MKILHVSTNEIEGGAARAANRLHQGLLKAGIDSQMLVQSRTTLDPRVHASEGKLARGLDAIRPTIDQLPLHLLSPAGANSFCLGWFPDRLTEAIKRLKPDLLHLHWVAKGALNIRTLENIAQPVVWTLHDMWPMTGGCFHSRDCLRFQDSCGACPQLKSGSTRDLSRWVWERKHAAWKKKPEVLICPSGWMAERASSSSLFNGRDIRRVSNGLDTQRFQPIDHLQARRLLGLPVDSPLVLFSEVKGPLNPYKGFHYLAPIFQALKSIDKDTRVELVLLGQIYPEQVIDIPVPVHRLGRFADDVSLALAYGAADLFISPSEIDNLPNTVMESLACGTPVAGFSVGGIPEMIASQQTGWLSPTGDAADLARGISWILEDRERWQKLSNQARQQALAEYDLSLQAERMIDLYTELIESVSLDG